MKFFKFLFLTLSVTLVLSLQDDSGSSVTYGLGSNGGYTIKDEASYKTPTIVGHLDNSGPYVDAKREQIVPDEKASVSNYYDGSRELNTFKVQCKMYASMNDCTHHSSCGWCQATSSCINGNQLGPLEPCPTSQYVFTSPLYNAGENRIINENVGGISMNLSTK
jgi:hypothetical protein